MYSSQGSQLLKPTRTQIQKDPIYSSISQVEELLCYEFKDPSLLAEALTHSSDPDHISYERLEFVGDAALGLAFTNYFYLTFPDFGPGPLTNLRTANTTTEKLARVAVKHGFYNLIRRNSPQLDEMVEDFALAVQRENEADLYGLPYGGSVIKAPKVLANIVESIVAAVYVDCSFNLEKLWTVFQGLLEPILTVEDLDEQPVTALYEYCQKRRKTIDFTNWKRENTNVNVFVDGDLLGIGSSEHYAIAKLNAARQALEKLGELGEDDVEMNNAEEKSNKSKHRLNEMCSKRRWPKPVYRKMARRSTRMNPNLGDDQPPIGNTDPPVPAGGHGHGRGRGYGRGRGRGGVANPPSVPQSGVGAANPPSVSQSGVGAANPPSVPQSVVGAGVDAHIGGVLDGDTMSNSTSHVGFAALIQGLASMQAQLTDHIQAGFQTLMDRMLPPDERLGSIRDFKTLKPREFFGTESALDAHDWFAHMETVLKAAMISEAHQVNVVQVQFQGLARSWFDAELIRLGGVFPDWKTFKSSFYKKYFPKDAETKMIRQFVNLTQGKNSVDTYAGEFDRLLKFASHMCRDDEDQATKFLQGLSSELQKYLASQPPKTLHDMVEAARRQERALGLGKGTQATSQKRNFSSMSGGSKNQSAYHPPKSGPSQSSYSTVVCNICGKKGYTKEHCYWWKRRCYGCGSTDHMIIDCSQNRSKGQTTSIAASSDGSVQNVAKPPAGKENGTGRGTFHIGAPLPSQHVAFQQAKGKGQGMVYAMIAKKVEASGDVITGLVTGASEGEEETLPLFDDSAEEPNIEEYGSFAL